MNKEQEKFLTDVCICSYGKKELYKDVTPEKAYHIVNDYSVKIHNGKLTTPKDCFVLGVRETKYLWVNLHKSYKIFAIVGKDAELVGSVAMESVNRKVA